LAGKPDFDVVGLRRRETQVARAEHDGSVRKVKPLQNLLRVAGELLELFVRPLGSRRRHELHFVELMLTNQSADVLSVRSRLTAETWGVCGVVQRQLAAVDDLTA